MIQPKRIQSYGSLARTHTRMYRLQEWIFPGEKIEENSGEKLVNGRSEISGKCSQNYQIWTWSSENEFLWVWHSPCDKKWQTFFIIFLWRIFEMKINEWIFRWVFIDFSLPIFFQKINLARRATSIRKIDYATFTFCAPANDEKLLIVFKWVKILSILRLS